MVSYIFVTKQKSKNEKPPGKDKKKGSIKTVGYLRVSTTDQDLEQNKADILKLANDKNFGKVKFIEEKHPDIKQAGKTER